MTVGRAGCAKQSNVVARTVACSDLIRVRHERRVFVLPKEGQSGCAHNTKATCDTTLFCTDSVPLIVTHKTGSLKSK